MWVQASHECHVGLCLSGPDPSVDLETEIWARLLACKGHGKAYGCVSAKYGPFDFIVAVPASPGRQPKRGYNQAFLLAKEISLVLHTSILPRPSITKPTKAATRFKLG